MRIRHEKFSTFKGLAYKPTKDGRFYVPVLHKSFDTMAALKKAVDAWVNKQFDRDKKSIKKAWR